MAIEIIPAYLLSKDKENEFILFLQKLPIPPRRKKEVLIEWCQYVGAALTRDLIIRLLGVDVEEV